MRKATGLLADNVGDIVVIDHAGVNIRGETYSILITVDGANAFVTAFTPRTQQSHETVQCLTEWMDTFHCNRRTFF